MVHSIVCEEFNRTYAFMGLENESDLITQAFFNLFQFSLNFIFIKIISRLHLCQSIIFLMGY